MDRTEGTRAPPSEAEPERQSRRSLRAALAPAARWIDEATARKAAIAVFSLAAASEALRLVLDAPWPGLDPTHGRVIGVFLTVLWTGAALILGLWPKRRSLGVIVVLAAFAFLPHGVVTRSGGSWLGAIFIVAAPVIAVLVWSAMRGRPRLGTPPTEIPARPGLDASSVH